MTILMSHEGDIRTVRRIIIDCLTANHINECPTKSSPNYNSVFFATRKCQKLKSY